MICTLTALLDERWSGLCCDERVGGWQGLWGRGAVALAAPPPPTPLTRTPCCTACCTACCTCRAQMADVLYTCMPRQGSCELPPLLQLLLALPCMLCSCTGTGCNSPVWSVFSAAARMHVVLQLPGPRCLALLCAWSSVLLWCVRDCSGCACTSPFLPAAPAPQPEMPRLGSWQCCLRCIRWL